MCVFSDLLTARSILDVQEWYCLSLRKYTIGFRSRTFWFCVFSARAMLKFNTLVKLWWIARADASDRCVLLPP